MYKYTIVSEDAPHEGTWLAWPHRHTYGTAYRDSIEPVWVAMAAALSGGEPYRVVQMPLTRKNVRGWATRALTSTSTWATLWC